MAEIQKADVDDLEQMMDRTSLAAVIAALADICHAKAEHVDVTWQDAGLAGSWRRDARKLEAHAGKVEN